MWYTFNPVLLNRYAIQYIIIDYHHINTFSTFDTFDIGFCGWSAPLRAPYAYAVHLDRALKPITWSLMDPRVK